MTPVPEKYADRPNLWRVACELAKFEDPYKAADMLIAFVGSTLKQEKETQR